MEGWPFQVGDTVRSNTNPAYKGTYTVLQAGEKNVTVAPDMTHYGLKGGVLVDCRPIHRLVRFKVLELVRRPVPPAG